MPNQAIPGRLIANGNQILPATTIQNVYDMSDPEHKKRLDHILAGLSVLTFTHTKTGTVNQLTGKEGAEYIGFTAAADYQEGDSWELNGIPLSAVNFMNGDPLCVGGLISGDTVMGRVTDGVLTLFLDRPVSNPNILDNSYFPDPINQRGQTEYTGNTYTIDRWMMTNQYCKLQVNDGHISLVSAQPQTQSVWIQQKLENPKQYLGKIMTFSVLLLNGTFMTCSGSIPSESISANTGFHSSILNGVDLWVLKTPSELVLVQISALKNFLGQTDIVAAKLELGPRQTLAHKDADGNWVLNDPPPDKQQELAKCQRYFEIIPVTVTTAIGTTRVIGARYAVPKRAIPAITFYPEGAAAGVGNYKNHYLDLNSPGFISKTGGDYIAATGVTYGTELGFGLIATTESVNKEPYYWGAYISAEL